LIDEDNKDAIDVQELKAFIAHARSNCQPTLSHEAATFLEDA